jgi:hypothetical protein
MDTIAMILEFLNVNHVKDGTVIHEGVIAATGESTGL